MFALVRMYGIASAIWLALVMASAAAVAQPAPNEAAAEADRLATEFIELYVAGKSADALPVGERALALGLKGYGADSLAVGNLHVNLASALKALGRYDEAEPHYKQGLALIAKHHSEDHLEVSHVVHEFGEMRHRQGRLDEAEPLYRRALDIRSKAKPGIPLALAVSLNSMGLMRQLRGPQAEAEAYYRRALAIREAELPSSHADIGQSYNNIGSLLHVLGRRQEALPLLVRGLAIWEKALPPDHGDVILGRDNLAHLQEDLGNFPEAERLFRQVLESFRRVRPADHADTSRALNNLGLNVKRQGKLSEAEELYRQSLAMKRRVLPATHREIAQTINNLAALYRELSRPIDAEPLYKEALGLFEAATPPDPLDTAMALNNLGSYYQEQGRLTEAEPLLKRTIDILQALPVKHPNLAKAINNLGLLEMRRGQPAKAEPLLARSLALREQLLPPGHPDIAAARNNLAQVKLALGKSEDARKLQDEALNTLRKTLPSGHPSIATAVNNKADVADQEGDLDTAELLYKEALKLRENALPPGHLDIAHSHNNLATLYIKRGEWARVVDHWRRSTAMLTARAGLGVETLGAGLTGTSEAETKRWSWQFWGLVKAAHQLVEPSDRTVGTLGSDAFVAAQWAAVSEASGSLAQMGVRAAAASPELAAIVRERQDLIAAWQKLDAARSAFIAELPETRDAAAAAATAKRLAEIEARLAAIDKRLGSDFKQYADIVKPTPPGIAEVQSLLAPSEALVLTLDTRDWAPLPEETFVWVVTKTDARWWRVDLGSKALDEEVAALRCGLDSASWAGEGAKRCRTLLGLAEDARQPVPLPFDMPRAHRLYRKLLGDAGDLINGKSDLLVVPTGPLTRLPWHVLISREPGPGADAKTAHWLVRDHAITVLPAVSSLKVLRGPTKPSAATANMIAFANPVLDGDEEGLELPDQLKLSLARRAARYRQSCALPASRDETKLAALALRNRSLLGAAGTAAAIRRWAPVPETARLVCDIAADPGFAGSRTLLADSATERVVRDLDKSGELARYKVVHFATHGALAGEVEGVREPGLLLTPPATAETTDDDGYLSASEITGLKLDADYLILSACNTAAGGETGGEALSGLARAFIYAGARALVVSHWSVYEQAAVSLVTTAARRLTDGKTGRAEALRQAMVEIIETGGKAQSHPGYWAPFVVVGEGGR